MNEMESERTRRSNITKRHNITDIDPTSQIFRDWSRYDDEIV